MKKYMTLDDLYQFFVEQGKNYTFNAKESDSVIVVKVPALFSASDESVQGLMPVHLKVAHTGLNRNSSYISKANMEKYMHTLKNKPILGAIFTNEDGVSDFHSHDMELDEDGNIVYTEKPVGIIPESCNVHLAYDKDEDKTYVEVDGYIYEDYGNEAASILREAGTKKVSCELVVENLAYNAKEKYLEIIDFYYSGVTILGSDPHTGEPIQEGMKGSNITLQDFSVEKDLLIDAIEKLNNTLSTFNIQKFSQEGGNHKMDELLKKYDVTAEDITFETDGLSDEELAAKFEEVFGESAEETEGEIVDEPDEDGDESEDVVDTFSVTLNGKTYSFEISLDEVISALTTVVNDTYSEADNAYYYVKVYEKNVVMVDYWSGRAYRQAYKSRNGAYSLSGDRIEVYARYLSKDEEAALDEMKKNYSAMEEKIAQYAREEAKVAKEAILNADDFNVLHDTEDYKAFAADVRDEANADVYSAKDVQAKCDEMLLKYYKTVAANFAAGTTPRTVKVGGITPDETKKGPYGSLFADKN